jgi:CO/xanthine dehydrogenase Mo-binding subunit
VTTVLAEPEIRIDGLDKVTGVARYTADRRIDGALVVRYLYASWPHAVVRSIDVARALSVPGVRAVVTGEDARGLRAGRRLQDWPLLAWDRIRFAGERVAAVAAETEAQADEAVASIVVDVEPLPAVLDPELALGPDAPVLHPEADRYRFLGPGPRHPVSHPNLQGELLVRKGVASDDELAARFAAAPIVVEEAFETGRQHQGYIEPHAAVVTALPDGRAEVVTTNKAPFSLRLQLAATFDMPPELIDVDSAVIGGDFGGKGLSIDEYVLLLLSRRTGRPVRMTAGYDEELRAYAPRHAGRLRLRSALAEDGRILAHDADLLFDGGAYAAAKPLPELILPGGLDVLAPYEVPALRIRLRTVYTNTVPGGHMRCPGELQAAFAGESHVDRCAAAVGLDPIEFRRRNVVRPGSVSAVGERIRQPMAEAVLAELAAAVPAALPPDSGAGIALVARRMEGGRQSVTLGLDDAGRVEIVTGLPDQGAGVHTMLARVAAATLSVPPSAIVVRRVTTSAAALDLGIGASRVTFIASRAVEDAARRLRAILEAAAATLAGGPTELRDGRFTALAGGAGVEWADAVAALRTGDLPVTGSFDSSTEGEPGVVDFTFAGLAVIADVDRSTGVVRIRDATFAADTGTIINPIAHRGQIEGGFAHGIGAALMEELLLDEGAVATNSLADYRLPAATDVPPVRIIVLPDAPGGGAFGAKMAGELSPSTVAPAIANAIEAATGARVRQVPMTPERVLATLDRRAESTPRARSS